MVNLYYKRVEEMGCTNERTFTTLGFGLGLLLCVSFKVYDEKDREHKAQSQSE